MIDCPICHVMNEDMARFCSECGQRLTRPQPSGGAGQPVNPAPSQPPESRPQKLNSPLLGQEEPPATQSPFRNQPLRQPGAAGSLGLHSPLLGGDDPGQIRASDPAGAAGKGKPHLHSPLLGGDEVDQYNDFPDTGITGRKGLRSPLLKGDQNSYDLGTQQSDELRSPLLGPSSAADNQSGRSGLRSPLLSGDDDQGFDPAPPSSIRPGGLRSPMLGGGPSAPEPYNYAEEYVEQEDDPNVLRSPLMAAKVPLKEKGPEIEPPPAPMPQAKPPIQPQPPTPQAFNRQPPPSPAPANPTLGTPYEPAKPVARPINPPDNLVAYEPPAGAQIPWHVNEPNANKPMPVDLRSSNPAKEPQESPSGPLLAPFMVEGKTPYSATDTGTTATPSPLWSPTHEKAAESTFASMEPSPMEATGPDRGKGLRFKSSAISEPATPVEIPEHHSFRTQEQATGGMPGFVKLLAIPLGLAAAVKVLTIQAFMQAGQPLIPVVADQVGQLVAIVCLIVICIAGSGRSQR